MTRYTKRIFTRKRARRQNAKDPPKKHAAALDVAEEPVVQKLAVRAAEEHAVVKSPQQHFLRGKQQVSVQQRRILREKLAAPAGIDPEAHYEFEVAEQLAGVHEFLDEYAAHPLIGVLAVRVAVVVAVLAAVLTEGIRPSQSDRRIAADPTDGSSAASQSVHDRRVVADGEGGASAHAAAHEEEAAGRDRVRKAIAGLHQPPADVRQIERPFRYVSRMFILNRK